MGGLGGGEIAILGGLVLVVLGVTAAVIVVAGRAAGRRDR